MSIGALFSELVAVSSKGELYQWKWSEPEPYRNAQVNCNTDLDPCLITDAAVDVSVCRVRHVM